MKETVEPSREACTLLADILEAGGNKAVAYTLRQAGPIGEILTAQAALIVRALTPPAGDEVERVARACCDDVPGRALAGHEDAPSFDDSEVLVQEYWRCIAHAALRRSKHA